MSAQYHRKYRKVTKQVNELMHCSSDNNVFNGAAFDTHTAHSSDDRSPESPMHQSCGYANVGGETHDLDLK